MVTQGAELTRYEEPGTASNGRMVPYAPPQQMPLAEVRALGGVLSASGFFADARQEAQAVAKILYGQELGLPAVASLQGINVIQNKLCISAALMSGAVKRSRKYDYRVAQHSDQICEIVFYERDGGGKLVEIGRSSFDRADATRAGTQNMGKYPRNMLFARALSNGVKFHCPDIFLGPVYVPEDFGAVVDVETGEIIETQSRPAESMPGVPQASAVAREAPHASDNGGAGAGGPAVWAGPGRCPRCNAPEGKPHVDPCRKEMRANGAGAVAEKPLTPMQRKKAALAALVAEEGFMPAENDRTAMASFIGELLARPLAIEDLQKLTAEDLEAAHAELQGRNAGRRQWFAVLSERSDAGLPEMSDDEQRAYIGEVIGREVRRRITLTAVEWDKANLALEEEVTSRRGSVVATAPADPTEENDPFADE